MFFFTYTVIPLFPTSQLVCWFLTLFSGVVGQMSGREADSCSVLVLMHSSLQARGVTEMAVMNHWPAVIDGVLKEILD